MAAVQGAARFALDRSKRLTEGAQN